MKRVAASLALALLAAGCASTPPPPPPPPKPSYSQQTVDGLYRGTSTRYQADSKACPSPGLVTLRVTEGHFEYRWKYKVMIPADIASDGTISGTLDDLKLTGQLIPAQPADGARPAMPQRLQGDVTNGVCAVHFTVTKRG